MTCAEVRAELGVLAVGALSAEREAAVRAHLAVCPGCRREHEDLVMVPDYLGLLTLEEAEQGPPLADSRLLDRLLAEVSAQRRSARRRRSLFAVAAAAALIVLAAFAGIALGGGDSGSSVRPTDVVRVSAQDPVSAARAAVTLREKAWGTAMTLTLTGVPGGLRCELIAESVTGDRQVAATWAVPSGGYDEERPLVVEGAVGIPMADLAEIAVATLSGEHLVTVPV